MTFADEGFLVVRDLVSPDQIAALNAELDVLFDHESRDGFDPGYVRMSHVLRSIPNPALHVRSVNLLELAVRTWQLCSQSGLLEPRDFILTNIQVFTESRNSKALFWHTDQRKNMIRAQMYIRGGEKLSGAFKFIRGSHKEALPPNLHRVPDEQMGMWAGREVVFDDGPGALVAFDSYGLHAKAPCIEERRTVMFEFQPRDSEYVKGAVALDTRLMTDLVLDSVYLLGAAKDPDTYNGKHGSQALVGVKASSWRTKARDYAIRRKEAFEQK